VTSSRARWAQRVFNRAPLAGLAALALFLAASTSTARSRISRGNRREKWRGQGTRRCAGNRRWILLRQAIGLVLVGIAAKLAPLDVPACSARCSRALGQRPLDIHAGAALPCLQSASLPAPRAADLVQAPRTLCRQFKRRALLGRLLRSGGFGEEFADCKVIASAAGRTRRPNQTSGTARTPAPVARRGTQ
jgi:hypothetical protein